MLAQMPLQLDEAGPFGIDIYLRYRHAIKSSKRLHKANSFAAQSLFRAGTTVPLTSRKLLDLYDPSLAPRAIMLISILIEISGICLQFAL